MALERLYQEGQQLTAECERLRLSQGASSHPQLRQWLRVAEAEVKRLTDVLIEKEKHIKLQESMMKTLEAKTDVTTASSSAVTTSPPQTTGGVAQFAQPGIVTGVTTGQELSTGQTVLMQVPPQHYFELSPQQLGAMQGAAPPQRTVGVSDKSMNPQGQMIQMTNQGYVGPNMQAPYLGQAQVPLVMQPPVVPDAPGVASSAQEGTPGHTGAVSITAPQQS